MDLIAGVLVQSRRITNPRTRAKGMIPSFAAKEKRHGRFLAFERPGMLFLAFDPHDGDSF